MQGYCYQFRSGRVAACGLYPQFFLRCTVFPMPLETLSLCYAGEQWLVLARIRCSGSGVFLGYWGLCFESYFEGRVSFSVTKV